MSSYLGTADRTDRTKAIVAVAAVHALLGAIILSGLNVTQIRHTIETMTTIDIRQPPVPPPVLPPKPAPKPQPMKKEAGPSAPKAEAAPVVAPPPKVPAPSPLAAAKIAGTGAAPNSGAAAAGTGTGAGGTGNGPGGGGYADYSRFTPAQRITKIPDSEYGRLSSTGIESGRVGVTIRVDRNGSVSDCRIARTSGDPRIDALMCDLTLRYIRFRPALDPSGRPVAQDITFFPNWQRRW